MSNMKTAEELSKEIHGDSKCICDMLNDAEAKCLLCKTADIIRQNRSPFTEKEIVAIKHMISVLAKDCREDVAGAILYTGAFRHLDGGDAAILALAHKLEFDEMEMKNGHPT